MYEDEDIERWITWRGKHIPIGKDGKIINKKYKDYNNEEDIAKLQKETDNLYKKLTKEEIKDLNGYTLTDFLEINEYLVGEDNRSLRNISDYTIEQIKQKIKNIDSAMNKSTINDNILVHRGADNYFLKDINIGDEIIIPTYNSTTIKKSIAEKFARHHSDKAMLEIRVPKGTKGIYMSDTFNENGLNEFEVMLDRNLKYKFINKEKIDPSGYDEEGIFVYRTPYTKYIMEVIK